MQKPAALPLLPAKKNPTTLAGASLVMPKAKNKSPEERKRIIQAYVKKLLSMKTQSK